MPYADSPETARRWASERAIDVWALFEEDVAMDDPAAFAGAIRQMRTSGARLALVLPSHVQPAADTPPALAELVDVAVPGPAAPSPFGLFAALEAAQVSDVRRLGVLGTSAASLEAGHRAGAGAIVGLASTGEARRALVAAQPDVIVAPAGLATLDADRYGARRGHRQYVLLNPGPCVTTDRVHRAIAGPDLCHREPEYTALFERVREKLLVAAGLDSEAAWREWAVALLAGSGTAAMEAMTGAAVRPGRALLVCQNGIYGERIATIARRLGHEVIAVEALPTQPIDPDAVATALDAHPNVDAVAVIHHETTTGLLNPVHEIAAIAHARDVPTLVDAISSLGAEELRLDGTGIDFVACTSNKCLHGLPGVAFVLVSPRGQARACEVPPRSLYFDLPNYLAAQAKRSVPFTPAVPATYALEAALDELFDEGVANRRVAYKARIEHLDAAMATLGFEPLVAAPHRSRSVRTYRLPDGVTYPQLHDAVKADGYVIYAGLGEAANTTFRVCALGALHPAALDGFVHSLAGALASFAPNGYSLPNGPSSPLHSYEEGAGGEVTPTRGVRP
jgi:2-aminoethylphosphonate-pyruvate transaminase